MTPNPTPAHFPERTRRHETWMRVVYGLTLLAAGLTGLLVLLAPASSETLLLLDTTDRLTSGLVGAAWLGMALTAAAGLTRPWHFSGFFFFLVMFHGTFLGAIGIPLWAAGVDWIMPHTLVSGISFVLAITATPWKELLARDQHTHYLADDLGNRSSDDDVHVHHHHATTAPWRQRTTATDTPVRTDSETLHRADVEDDALRRQLEAARAEEARRLQALNEARRLREDYETRLRGTDQRRAA